MKLDRCTLNPFPHDPVHAPKAPARFTLGFYVGGTVAYIEFDIGTDAREIASGLRKVADTIEKIVDARVSL